MEFFSVRQKRQYNLKTTIFGRSPPTSIGFLRKHIQIFMQNLKAIGATSFELSRYKKLTTHRYTNIHFRQTIFFQFHTYIWTKEKAKFDNWFLTPIQGLILNQRLTKQKCDFFWNIHCGAVNSALIFV